MDLGRGHTPISCLAQGRIHHVQTFGKAFFCERRVIEHALEVCKSLGCYMRFCQMMLNKGKLCGTRLLKPETVEMMTKNQ